MLESNTRLAEQLEFNRTKQALIKSLKPEFLLQCSNRHLNTMHSHSFCYNTYSPSYDYATAGGISGGKKNVPRGFEFRNITLKTECPQHDVVFNLMLTSLLEVNLKTFIHLFTALAWSGWRWIWSLSKGLREEFTPRGKLALQVRLAGLWEVGGNPRRKQDGWKLDHCGVNSFLKYCAHIL